MNEREIALGNVTSALPVFEQINELYCAANSLNQQALVMQTDDERFKANNRFGFFRNSYELIGLCCGFAAVEIPFALLSKIIPDNGFFQSLFMIACLAAGVFGAVKGHQYKVKKVQKNHVSTQKQIDSLAPQMEQISQEIYRVTTENQALIDAMPRDYRYYDAVAFFERALVNGQADSMKEAINLYEEYIHRQNMELHDRQMLAQSQMQSDMLANIERSSHQTAVNSGIAAAFSVLNYLS